MGSIYRPLQDVKKSFRLIELFPADDTERIQCRLLESTLSNPPQYHATSYEWGSPEFTKHIVINDMDIEIRNNLYEFLCVIQPSRSTHALLLFVDALCIDQSNIPERNSQVQLMGYIYKQAKSVIVWLGSAANRSDELINTTNAAQAKLRGVKLQRKNLLWLQVYNALERLQKGSDANALLFSGPQIDYSAWASGVPFNRKARANLREVRRWQQEMKDVRTDPDEILSRDSEDIGLNAFFERSYWQRIWIIQELVLAQDLRIFCGEDSLDWEAFCTLYDMYRTFEDLQPETSTKYRHAERQLGKPDIWSGTTGANRVVQNVMSQRVKGNDFSLEALIKIYDMSQCSEDLDHVYGLLGLVNERGAHSRLQVDYKKTTLQLFNDVVYHCFPWDVIGFASILLDVLKLRARLPEMRSKEIERLTSDAASPGPMSRYFHLRLVYLGHIQSFSASLLPETSSRILLQSCDVSIPERDFRPSSPIHFHEHQVFLEDKHFITTKEAAVGDQVYWIAHTSYGLIFREEGPRYWRGVFHRSLLAVSRCTIMSNLDFEDATRSLQVDFGFSEIAKAPIRIPGMLSLRLFSPSVRISMGNVLQLLHDVQELIESDIKEFRRVAALRESMVSMDDGVFRRFAVRIRSKLWQTTIPYPQF